MESRPLWLGLTASLLTTFALTGCASSTSFNDNKRKADTIVADYLAHPEQHPVREVNYVLKSPKAFSFYNANSPATRPFNNKTLDFSSNSATELHFYEERKIEPEYQDPSFDRTSLQTPPISKVAFHIADRFITSLEDDTMVYRAWDGGKKAAKWVEDHLNIDFHGWKVGATTNLGEIGMTIRKDW